MGLIVSLLISIFAPNVGNEACAALLAAIPSNIKDFGSCGDCDFNIGGLLSVDVTASVACTLTLENSLTCTADISGGGDALGVAFGGGGDLAIDANCAAADFGEIDADIAGAFSFDDGVDLNACDIAVASNAGNFECECNSGCDDDFSVEVSCTDNADNQILAPNCFNVLAIFEEIQGAIDTATTA